MRAWEQYPNLLQEGLFSVLGELRSRIPPCRARGASRRLGKDSMSGSTMQKETEQLCADMLHRPGQESYSSTDSYPVYSEGNIEVRRSDTELQNERKSILTRVRKATPPRREIKSYMICEIPDVVLPGLRRQTQSKKMKATEIGNSRKAIDHIRRSGGLQLFARSQKPNDSTSMRGNGRPWPLTP